MLTNIMLMIVVAYIVAKLLKGGTLGKVQELLGLVAQSTKAQGPRGTAHAVLDGLFDGGKAARGWAAGATNTVKNKAAGLRPSDYRFDADSGELILHVTKQQDLCVGRNDDGTTYAYLFDASGGEVVLNQRAFTRQVKYLERKGKLSDAQATALKDFLRLGRGGRRA